jgi:nucleotide-binding universal stress UspA family protein
MIKKVLVALDGSEPAEKALNFALNLAEKYSAKLVLISVVPHVTYLAPMSADEPFPTKAYIEYSNEMEARHRKILSDAKKKVKKSNPNLKVSIELAEGKPADKIIETAEKGDFDIVVLGHRGLGDIREFLLGSVSHRVAHKTTRTVIIVK